MFLTKQKTTTIHLLHASFFFYRAKTNLNAPLTFDRNKTILTKTELSFHNHHRFGFSSFPVCRVANGSQLQPRIASKEQQLTVTLESCCPSCSHTDINNLIGYHQFAHIFMLLKWLKRDNRLPHGGRRRQSQGITFHLSSSSGDRKHLQRYIRYFILEQQGLTAACVAKYID